MRFRRASLVAGDEAHRPIHGERERRVDVVVAFGYRDAVDVTDRGRRAPRTVGRSADVQLHRLVGRGGRLGLPVNVAGAVPVDPSPYSQKTVVPTPVRSCVIRTRGQSVIVPELSDSAAAFTATVQGAWIALHDNRNEPPAVSPTGDPSVVEYTAHVEAGPCKSHRQQQPRTRVSGRSRLYHPCRPWTCQTCRICRARLIGRSTGPAGPLGPRMFHEILRAPFTQTNRFRSPDVARLPSVAGSTHAVTTPL